MIFFGNNDFFQLIAGTGHYYTKKAVDGQLIQCLDIAERPAEPGFIQG
jgi:hypothetical protein